MRRIQAHKYNIHLNISNPLIRYKDPHFLSYTRANTIPRLFPQDLLEINCSGLYFLVHLTWFYMIHTCIDFVYHLFTWKHCLPFSAMPCDEIKGMAQRQKSARPQILSGTLQIRQDLPSTTTLRLPLVNHQLFPVSALPWFCPEQLSLYLTYTYTSHHIYGFWILVVIHKTFWTYVGYLNCWKIHTSHSESSLSRDGIFFSGVSYLDPQFKIFRLYTNYSMH